ncbi:MAG: hypothetical protein RL199_127 [Pseudomonadota bacterium]
MIASPSSDAFSAALGRAEGRVAQRPTSPEAWSELGGVWLDAGRPEAALPALEHAAALAPSEPEHRYNLALALLSLTRFGEARRLLERVVAERPMHARAFGNLGAALEGLGLHEAQLEACRKACALVPEDDAFRWNLALALLRLGRYREGWEAYESRYARFPTPAVERTWRGDERPGETLVVAAEQGFGDTFQFLRLLRHARARVGRLVLAVHAPLVPLLSSMGLADEVVPHAAMPAVPLRTRLMSLPLLVDRPEPETDAPVISAPPARVEAWRNRLGTERPVVAVAWQGSRAYAADVRRSPPVAVLGGLLDGLEATVVSVQRGEPDRALAGLGLEGPHVVEPGDALDRDGAFLDTVAILTVSDLVVTSDTAVAHLAGVLGRPVFVALPHVADWRWGTGGPSTPWYPTMRLFRQPSPGDWGAVFRSMREAILSSA